MLPSMPLKAPLGGNSLLKPPAPNLTAPPLGQSQPPHPTAAAGMPGSMPTNPQPSPQPNVPIHQFSQHARNPLMSAISAAGVAGGELNYSRDLHNDAMNRGAYMPEDMQQGPDQAELGGKAIGTVGDLASVKDAMMKFASELGKQAAVKQAVPLPKEKPPEPGIETGFGRSSVGNALQQNILPGQWLAQDIWKDFSEKPVDRYGPVDAAAKSVIGGMHGPATVYNHIDKHLGHQFNIENILNKQVTDYRNRMARDTSDIFRGIDVSNPTSPARSKFLGPVQDSIKNLPKNPLPVYPPRLPSQPEPEPEPDNAPPAVKEKEAAINLAKRLGINHAKCR